MESSVVNISFDERIEYWKNCSVNDLKPWTFHDHLSSTIDAIQSELKALNETDAIVNPARHYIWSVDARDFIILLRDALLGIVKYEQHKLDDRPVDEFFKDKVATAIRGAATELESIDFKTNKPEWQHQISPVSVISEQLSELKDQSKKVLRSHDKVKDFRNELEVFLRDFNLQLNRHISVIDTISGSTDNLQKLIENLPEESNHTSISECIDDLSKEYVRVENVQELDSIDILTFPDNETHTFPVDVQGGQLAYKSINIRSELSRWFSSNIYTRFIELDNRVKLAVERWLLISNDIRTRLAGKLLVQADQYRLDKREFKSELNTLVKNFVEPLEKEKDEFMNYINEQLGTELFASNIYNKKQLFLPYSGTLPVDNLSREAYRRFSQNSRSWYQRAKDRLYNFMSRYIEMKQTSYTAFIANKLRVNQSDERFYLFLKDGYLGKSFTVERPKYKKKIIEAYDLWKKGFAESVLLFGPSGIGKSTLIGMLSQGEFDEEVILPRPNEPFLINHKSFDSTCDLKKVISNISLETQGQKIICCIDDLEQWHDGDISLYDNISNLIDSIYRYRKNVFFIVSCGTILKEKIESIRVLDPIFNTRVEVGKMSAGKIKEALVLRAKAVRGVSVSAINEANEWSDMIRVAKGNVGAAMLELCRLADVNYDADMKSKEFNKLIQGYGDFLRYLFAYQQVSLKHLAEVLSDKDYKDTVKNIDHLVSQKVLLRSKYGVVSLNPLLRTNVERVLIKSGE